MSATPFDLRVMILLGTRATRASPSKVSFGRPILNGLSVSISFGTGRGGGGAASAAGTTIGAANGSHGNSTCTRFRQPTLAFAAAAARGVEFDSAVGGRPGATTQSKNVATCH